MADYQRNLVIVQTPGLQALSDFEQVKSKLAARAPDIGVFVVNGQLPNSVSRRQAGRLPSLVFSPTPLRQFRPLRGKIYAGKRHTKTQEMERLKAAGIPVPSARIIEPDTRLDPEIWGPFTVVKPDSNTKQGRGVRLVRTADVRWIDTAALAPDDERFGRELVAQRFIDTGPHAESHRVMVVMGKAVYSVTSRASSPRPPMDVDAPLDLPIASNAGERTLTLNFDAAIIAVAERAAAAFREVPVLGVDVIREAGTGALYVLEVNSGGFTWHLSSNYFAPNRRKFGLDFHNQFGALDIIADALIDTTRREAV